MLKSRFNLFLILLILSSALVFAHGEIDNHEETRKQILPMEPLTAVYIAGGIAIVVLLLSLLFHKGFAEHHKKLAFLLVTIPIGLATLYLAGATVYLNVISETGGPVHWHADYDVFVCGEKLNLMDPHGATNRIGEADLHEHNDNRIHLEGIVLNYDEITLGSYFRAIKGELEQEHLVYPTNEKIVDVKNGDSCPNGVGSLKVYVNGEKIENYENYVIYPNPNVPPGDCIIIKFDSDDAETTDIICESWEVAGWEYGSFKRPLVKIGDRTWQ